MAMNGADRLCDALLDNGVDVCFANPGTSEMHFVAALDRKPAMRCVLGLFEGVVTGAADGYARMARRPAATLLHTGPGLANGLANLHNARRAHSPIINVVGDHASYHLKHDAPLASDIESLAKPMSDWVRRVGSADSVGEAVSDAYLAACSFPGIATLILPADSAWNPVAPTSVAPVILPAKPMPPAETIRSVAVAITNNRGRFGLVIGGDAALEDGVEWAGRIAAAYEGQVFAEMLPARVARGRGRTAVRLIPYPIDVAIDTLREIDLLVLVGAPEPVSFFAYPGKPNRLLREGSLLLSLADRGDDLAAALEALAAELNATRPIRPVVTAFQDGPPPQGKLTGDAVSSIIARHLPEGAIVCNEGSITGGRFFGFSEQAPPHDFLSVTGGSIGFSIPAAVGAAIACPDRKVITYVADGSGLYTLQGLWTQARENLDVLTVVLANRAYAILLAELRNLGVNEVGRNAKRMMSLTDPAPDWVKLAEGMGVEAASVRGCEEFSDRLVSALRRRGPFLIECLI
jgi:acetolactate synthase I/II/III large subunit